MLSEVFYAEGKNRAVFIGWLNNESVLASWFERRILQSEVDITTETKLGKLVIQYSRFRKQKQ